MEETNPRVSPLFSLATSGMEILLEGEWKPGSISASFDPTIKRPTNAAVEYGIAREWAAAERDAAIHDRVLFPGPLVRVLRYEPHPGKIHFWLGPTDYREYLGTRALDDTAFRADPLSACAAVRTSDGKILVGRRGHRNMEGAGWWHVMAGYVDPGLDRGGDGIDVFATIVREIEEEAGFPREEISVVCLGLMRWNATHKSELIFAAETTHSSDQIRAIDNEHDEFRAIDDHPRAIQAFLEDAGNRIAAPGRACLVRYAAWRHNAAL